MATAKQGKAARQNVTKAQKAATSERSIARMPKKTRTALGKQGAAVARRNRAGGDSPKTKAELYELAKRRDLPGRSKMGGPSSPAPSVRNSQVTRGRAGSAGSPPISATACSPPNPTRSWSAPGSGWAATARLRRAATGVGPDEHAAVAAVLEKRAFALTSWKVMAELPNPVNFEAAAARPLSLLPAAASCRPR